MDQNPDPIADLETTPHERRRAVLRLWRAETVYVVVLAAFSVLALLAHFNAYFYWDLKISRGLQTLDVPGLFQFMRGVSVIGNSWHPHVLASLTVIAFFIVGRRSEAAGLALSAGGGAIINNLIKLLIARPRPSNTLVSVFRARDSLSFPSGHVTFYVCYFGFLFFVAHALLPRKSLARRLALVFTALPVALVGLSRVYLGEHWPSDTLGAYLSSGLWLAFSLDIYRRWKAKATLHPPTREQ